MAEKFIIAGNKPLKGEIEVGGAKNATFPILAASLLTEKPCVIDNIPLIEDILKMIEIIKELGAEVFWLGDRKIKIVARNIDLKKLNESLVKKLRGSVLIVGSLLARFGEIKIPQPGGCLIGARSISTHLDLFSQLGVKIDFQDDGFLFQAPLNISAKEVILNECSVTTTENALLFLASRPQEIIIKNADGDYPVQELARILQKMGVKIEGWGTHTILIKGAKKLEGFEHKIMYDPLEAGTFILLAAATKSNIIIKNVEFRFLEMVLKKLKDFGLPFEIIDEKTIKVSPWHHLILDKLQALPYPGLPTDLLPLFGVLATQAEGLTLLHDPLYENRLKYLEELNKMGAQIIFADPHRAIVKGPTALFGIEINSPDIRGGASLIVGALLAKGKIIINNIHQIDRGYEKIEEKLQKIGADIKRVKE